MRRFFMTSSSLHQVHSPPEAHVIVFLKAPRPGFVKTRLAASLGDDRACRIYTQLVEGLLSRINTLTDVELRFTPDDAIDECSRWIQEGWLGIAQGDGGLGERLARAFKEAFQRGADRVIAIGSDCPDVGEEEIREANRALDDHSVVVGPAKDGGYWLIGMNAWYPVLFEGIDWSTDRVLAQTESAAGEMDLSIALLDTLEDIDDLESWQRFERRDSKN